MCNLKLKTTTFRSRTKKSLKFWIFLLFSLHEIMLFSLWPPDNYCYHETNLLGTDLLRSFSAFTNIYSSWRGKSGAKILIEPAIEIARYLQVNATSRKMCEARHKWDIWIVGHKVLREVEWPDLVIQSCPLDYHKTRDQLKRKWL